MFGSNKKGNHHNDAAWISKQTHTNTNARSWRLHSTFFPLRMLNHQHSQILCTKLIEIEPHGFSPNIPYFLNTIYRWFSPALSFFVSHSQSHFPSLCWFLSRNSSDLFFLCPVRFCTLLLLVLCRKQSTKITFNVLSITTLYIVCYITCVAIWRPLTSTPNVE